MTYILKNWSVGSEDGPYTAPELRSFQLHGEIFDHPNFRDGHEITTSCIKDVSDGGIVTTRSGSVYELDEPCPEYVEWCKEQGCHVPTKDEPIKVHD